MGFQERSAWACLVVIAAVYTPYFWVVLREPMAALGLFVIAAVAVAALLVAFHVINALATRSIRATGRVPPIDELDRKIELVAAKWSGLVLALAVVAWTIGATYLLPAVSVGAEGKAAEIATDGFTVPGLRAMAAVQWLFGGFVAANLVYYAVIVAGYRKVASG